MHYQVVKTLLCLIYKNFLRLLQTLFIESACDDVRIIEENVRSVKISSPDVGCTENTRFSVINY